MEGGEGEFNAFSISSGIVQERDEIRRMKDREGRGERKGENARCERASERTHEQGVAVAVAAAALPPHH